MHSEADRIRVLYVAGWWHNGSTVAGNVLGAADGVFFAGEVRHIFWTVRDGKTCGCGLPLPSCAVWRPILDRARFDPDRLFRLQRRLTRMRDLPRIQLALRGRGPLAAEAHELTETLGRLYRAIAGETGCALVVDSSKSPVYASILQRVPGIELSMLHLVRDPRGWCLSSLGRGHDAEVGTVEGTLLWDLVQLYCEAAWGRAPRYRRFRYEDFVRRPEATLADALEAAGMAGAALPFTGPHEVEFEPSHTAGGNLNRFRGGRVAIVPDERWPAELPDRERRLVTALTWPLLLRYGYRLRRATASASTASVPARSRSSE